MAKNEANTEEAEPECRERSLIQVIASDSWNDPCLKAKQSARMDWSAT